MDRRMATRLSKFLSLVLRHRPDEYGLKMDQEGWVDFEDLIDVLAAEGRPLSEIVAPLRRYHASGEINRRVRDTASVLEAIEGEHAGAPVVSKLDGLLVRYDDWWFNVRSSNTEPLVRLNLEADDAATMAARRDQVLAIIRA